MHGQISKYLLDKVEMPLPEDLSQRQTERIVSRLMIVQGANDPRVPVTESRQFVERLVSPQAPAR